MNANTVPEPRPKNTDTSIGSLTTSSSAARMTPGARRSTASRRASRMGHTNDAVTSASSAESTNSVRKLQRRTIHSPTSGANAVATKPDTP